LHHIALLAFLLKDLLLAGHFIGFIDIALSQRPDAGDDASNLELGCNGLKNFQDLALR
jgi:hypothetical protein